MTRRSAFWTAGSLASRTTVQYRPTLLQLAITPDRPLEEGLDHQLQLQPTLRLADGRPLRLAMPLTLEETNALPIALASPARSASENADSIAALLQSRCGACHDGRPLFAFSPITLYEPSISDSDRPRVDPFEPGRSVLLERILPEFPRFSGQPMPPVWSDQTPLSPAEVRSIEQWILDGAPR